MFLLLSILFCYFALDLGHNIATKANYLDKERLELSPYLIVLSMAAIVAVLFLNLNFIALGTVVLLLVTDIIEYNYISGEETE